MSLSDLLTDYPKSWANLNVNSVTASDPTKGLFPYTANVTSKFVATPTTLNTADEIHNNTYVNTLGSRTFIITHNESILNAGQRSTGTLLLEIGYELPPAKHAAGSVTFLLGTGDGSGFNFSSAITPIPMSNQAVVPGSGVTRFESLISLTKSAGVTSKIITQAPILI